MDQDPLAADLLFNAAMLATDGMFLLGVRREPGSRWMLLGGVGVGILATLLFVLLVAWWDGGTLLIHIRLLAWGIFLHGPLVLGGGALLARRTQPRAAAGCGALAAVIVVAGAEAFVAGPSRLQVRRVEVRTTKLERRLRVVVIADIQTDRVGAYERRALALAVAERPDLVLLPGDYIQIHDREARRAEMARLNALLREVGLSAPLGVFAVRGNVEGDPEWVSIFEGIGTTVTASRAFDLAPLRLVAIDIFDSFNTQLRVPPAPDGRFQLAFGHAPDFALGDVAADLMVAGHTHGGQVQLPGIGPLITFSEVPRAWARGTVRLADGRTLVVSSGVGVEQANAPRMRFLCPPELVVIELVPAPAR